MYFLEGEATLKNYSPDIASDSQDERGALVFEHRVATGLRGPI